MIDFDEYMRQGEPHKKEKGYAWQTAIGLQAVDGLKPSSYLLETAIKDINGEISIDEAEELIKSYYQSKDSHAAVDDDQYEADIAATNIRRLLTEKTFAFTLVGFTSIHRRIFEGVLKYAGQIRDYNITKREWVLRGDTVLYVSAPDLKRAIEYDLAQERQFDFTRVDKEGFVKHLSEFVSGLWQIHPFGEGNTRTTAVFTILYLRSLGFDVTNDLFAKHSWYFRNALVRANYQNLQKGVIRDTRYLELFFRNLLLGENNELRNRYLIINPPSDLTVQESQVEYNALTEQVTEQATEQVKTLLFVVGREQKSLKEIMTIIGLKHRPTFLENYLRPAIHGGFLAHLYPDNPNHPKQKYHLTPKGTFLYNQLKNSI